MFLAYSSIFTTLGIIETYLPTFGYALADSGIFRFLAQLDIFMYIKGYSEPIAHSGIFRTVDSLKPLKSNLCIFWILIEQIQTYLELSLT